MAESKMKFTFLDDDGEPIKSQEEETQDEQTQKEAVQDEDKQDETPEGSTDQEAEGEEAEGEEGSEGDEGSESDDEGSSDEGDEPDDEVGEDPVRNKVDNDVVDYEELPEAVQKFLDLYEDTGGKATMEDFLFINQDLSKLSQDEVIRRYMKQQNPALDDEDVAFSLEDEFGFDPDIDEERDIRKKKVAKKKYYGEALKALEQQKAKYGADLASRQTQLDPAAQEAIQFKQSFEQRRAQEDKAYEQQRQAFIKQTNKVLGKDFKGFEVKVGDTELTYKPDDVRKLKESNLDVNNFLSRFLDKDGSIKDVAGYHRALAFGSNPEGVAEHFYNLGKAAALEEESKEGKNYKDQPRKTQSAHKPKNAPKFRFLEDESEQKGKIRLKHY